MKYSVTVIDRGRPIARHHDLTLVDGKEIAAAYHAIGWAHERILLERMDSDGDERLAA
ncbi:MAG TPA: hypothetical protein VFB34_09835 [Chloroflexota bacterium]|nr:hypothetical protein [Chloroflexota bacterium]